MNRMTAVGFLLSFCFSNAKGGVVEKSYHFSDYRIGFRDDFQTVAFHNTLMKGKEGEPLLPYRAVMLLLPPGEEAVSVEVMGESRRFVPGAFTLYPRQPVRSHSDPGYQSLKKNDKVYLSQKTYPSSPAGQISTHYFNGYGFAMTAVTPVVYRPSAGEVSFYEKVTVRITTRPKTGDNPLANLRASFHDAEIVKQTAQNPEMIAGYTAGTDGDTYHMLIVTGPEFVEAFRELADHYLYRGIEARIVTVDSIDLSMNGQDLQEKIRNFIIQEYQSSGIEHVLLGGDTEIIPYRGFYCQVESGGETFTSENIAADLYYAALDGTWDADGDGLWGEIGEEDLLPEVSVGRLPASDLVELNPLLHKIMTYQNAPVQGELRTPFLVGELAWEVPLTWGSDYLDMIEGTRNDHDYTTVGIPDDHDVQYLYDRDAGHDDAWDAEDLIERINQGCTFIYHWGHSNSGYNMRLSSGHLTNENFAQVNGVDHNYINVFSMGCSPAAFHLGRSIAEKMVVIDNFAVSFSGFSHLAWSNEGETDGPAPHLNREFVNGLYGLRIGEIGEVHRQAKIRSAPWVNAPDQFEEGAFRWTFYAFALLGDPAMPVWTDEPKSVDIAYEPVWSGGQSRFDVTVTSGGSPVPNLRCVLARNDMLIGSGKTDADGLAGIGIQNAVSDLNGASVIVSGYNCLPTSFPVTITGVSPDGPFLPTETRLIRNTPNPFNPVTRIDYSLADDGPVEITVFTITGQRVKILMREDQTAGTHSVVWRGNDDRNNRAASGIFLCTLRTPGVCKTIKITLIR